MSTNRTSPWWMAEEGKVHEDLFALLSTLHSYEARRRRDISIGLALYGDKTALGHVTGGRNIPGLGRTALSYNIVKSVVDAAQAHIAAQHTLSRVLTQRGNWTLQKKAKRCEQLIEGDFDRNNVYTQAHEGFLDAGKTGLTGFKVYTLNGRTQIDLVKPGEVLVDPWDGRNRNPRAIYQISFMDRETIRGLYGDTPERRKAIDKAPRESGKSMFPWLPQDTTLDTIKVVEGWRTPDPEEYEDPESGRHVICIQGATLLDEDWDRSLPFAFWRYDTETSGFYGRGIAQNLHDLQIEINYILRKMSQCLHTNAGFRILLRDDPNGDTEVVEEDITNSPGQVIRVADPNAVMVQVANQIPPEFRQQLEDAIRRGFEQEGVSQLAAQSKKPAGLNSGEAIREYNDIESQRFAVKSKSFERFIGVHLATKVIEEKKHAAKTADERPTRAQLKRRRGVKFMDIRWSDIDLDPNDYAVKVSPSSELPRTSAGRQATVDSWMGAGLVDREQYLSLSRNPDLDEFLSFELAPYEIVLDALEDMIEDGVYSPPEPVQNIQLSLRLASNAVQKHIADGVPDERTELIYRYIADLEAMQAEAEQAAMQKQAGQQSDSQGEAQGGV